MLDLFLKIVNMSIAASYLVLAVVLLRLILKNAPRWIFVLLWGIVALRLLCPFSIESSMSLIPSAQPIPESVISDSDFHVQIGIPAVDGAVDDFIGETGDEDQSVPNHKWENIVSFFCVIWALGMLQMVGYTVFSYLRLHRRVATAIRYRDGVFISENVVSPFILGVFSPRIYLPYGLDDGEVAYILSHEQAHIKRKDHWWKPLGFLLLTIHWFNPLMWVAYCLLCRDIEQACDEKVVCEFESEQRADYSQTLLKCSVNRRTIAACPLAFGEVGVKERVKNVLSYKKPAFLMIAIAIIACIVVAVCFLTDPVSADKLGLRQPTQALPDVTGQPGVCLFDRDEDVSQTKNGVSFKECPELYFSWSYQQGYRSVDLVVQKDGVETEVFNFELGRVQSVYISDVTGDGNADLCANVYYFFSGIPSYNAVFVYDLANECYYTLAEADNNNHSTKVSYYLRLNNGQVVCDKLHEATQQILASGALAFSDYENGKQIYLQPQVSYDSPVEYVFHGEDFWWDMVTITVCADGTCDISFNPRLNDDLTSDWAQGTYIKEDGKLIMTTEEGKTYAFRFEGENLVFMADKSDALPDDCMLYDGAVLEANPYFP